jgi:hypothetical protein
MYLEEFSKRELSKEEQRLMLLELAEKLKGHDLFPEATEMARKSLENPTFPASFFIPPLNSSRD